MGASWRETGRWRGADRWVRAVALAGAVLADIALVALIVGGLRVNLPKGVASVLTAIDLRPVPSPSPSPPASPAPDPAGQAAPEGRRAIPREVHAVPPMIPLPVPPAPVATSTGVADTSGAALAGTGGGAGGSGEGMGAGGAGGGTGGGGSRPVKIAGTIAEDARDFPAASRAERLGRSVVVSFLVGTDGRVSDCRIVQPSGSPEADAITCGLIVTRFRYRPALDSAGQPVAARLGWRQSWHAP